MNEIIVVVFTFVLIFAIYFFLHWKIAKDKKRGFIERRKL